MASKRRLDDSKGVDFDSYGEKRRKMMEDNVSKEKETDQVRIAARLKQIAFGKNTVGYDNYIKKVPKHARRGYNEHPRTPDPYEKQSVRMFNGRIHAWRREIHLWDDGENQSTQKSSFYSSNSSSNGTFSAEMDFLLKPKISSAMECSSSVINSHVIMRNGKLLPVEHVAKPSVVSKGIFDDDIMKIQETAKVASELDDVDYNEEDIL